MSFLKSVKHNFYLGSITGNKITPTHHIVFWCIYFIFNTLRWGSYYSDYLLSLKGNLLGFPLHMVLCYFTIYFLLPKFIYKRKFLSFSFILLISIFLMVLIKFYLTYLLISHNVWPEGPVETTSLSLNYIIVMMLGELYVVSFVTAIWVTVGWLHESKKAANLEKLQLETELRFLRSQISPHFFFNTLNNIYSLSLEKSTKTSDTILKLSALMRYLLYETREKKQSLEKEILCIQNYLDLERIRHNESIDIQLNISGETEGKKIDHMLLIPFIENAFKHGVNKNIGHVFIAIDLIVKNGFLYFKIINTLPRKDGITNKTVPGGIGIANVKKRLELGYRDDEHELKNHETEEEYVVELKLKLK